ncbi:MAG: Cna B-type domain-containing protein, partial [Clostridiales bacterium]|nr:Cna B-type domain-containing protein [Clostridiales bacterium]
MMNRNHLLRRMVALLLCTCMLLGNVSTAVSDNFIVQSNDVPISDAVEAASVAADNGSNAQEKVMLKNYAEYSFKLSADAGETQPLPEYVEDGQYMYFSMDFELLNNPESKISLLKEAYMAGEIDADTIFMCGINFLPFVENSNYPVSFDSPYNQAIDTNTGLTIFRWWVDEQLSEIHLRFTDEILSREGEISGAKIAFEGYLVTGGKNDNGELRFGVDGQTISLKAKQEYDLVKSVGTPYYSVDASSYLVDYTVTLQLDQAMKLSETDSALYAAALTLVDTVSNDSALSGTIIDVSVASAPEGETVTVTNSGNGKTNTMVIASPDDQILQKGTYTFVYKMKVNNDAALAKLAGYSEDQKTNTVELKENGQSLETPLTASAVITWEDVTDNQFKIEKDVFLNKAPDYNGIYIKDNDYCLDYRVVVYIREPVHTFTVADANWGSFDFREDEAITLEGIDDSEGYWDAPIQTAQLDQVRAAVTVTTENHPYGRDNKTTACKMITITAPEGEMLLPGAYHLRIPADVNDAVNATLNNTYSQYFENWAMLHRVDGNPTNVSDNYKSNIPLPFTTTKDGGYETNKDTGEFLTYEGKPVIRWDVWFGWDFYNKTTFEDTLTGMELLVNNDYPFEIHSFVNPKTLDETLVSLKTLEGTDSLDCLDFKADGSGFTVYAENLDSNSNDVLGKLYKIVYFTVPADDPSSTTGEYLTSGLKNKYTANHVPELGGGFGNGPHTGEVEPNIGAGARLYVSKKHVIELNDSLTKWKITCSNEQNKIPFANFTNLDIIDLVPRDQKPIGEVFVHYSDEHPITVEMLCDNNARIQLVEGTHYTIKKQMDGYAFGDDGKYGFAVDLNMETVAAAMAEKNAVYFKTIDVLCYLENEKHPSGQNYRIHNDGWLSYTNQGNDLEEGANAYYDRGFSTKTKGIIGYGDYYDPTAPRVYYVWENNSEGKPSYKGQQSFTGGYDDAPESGDGQKEILWRIFIGAREFGNDDNPITVTVTDTFSDNQMFPTYTGKDVKELFLIRAEDSMDYIIIPDNVVVNGNSFSLTFTVPGGGWASNNKDKSKDILIFYHTIIKPEAIKDALDAADSDADNVTLEYSNTVSAGWNGESYTFPTCTGSHAFSTTMLDKSADIITAVSEIEYSVLINENRIMLNNGNPLELTDELGQGKADYLYLDDSVRLVNLDTDAVLSAGSSVTENTYTITWETGDTKGFTISVPDGQRLKLTYHVRPQVEVGNEAPTLTNSATLVGKTASHEQDSFMVNAHYQQATYKPDEGQAAVIIRKKEGGNSVENWLAGAEFTAYPVLEDGTLGSVFKKVTTDDTGKATFDFDCDSEFGSYTVYCIKETKAPEGYQGSEQEWYFYFSSIHHEYANEEVERIVQLLREKQNTQQDKPITITQGFHQVVSYVTVENTAITSDLRIRKVNAAGADLEAATFVLQDAKGNRMPDPVAGVDQGVYYYTFSDLKNGTYTLTETMPPEGYQFSTPNSWTIVLDAGSEDETDSVSVVWPENATDAMKAYVVETTNAAVPTLTVLNDVAAPAELSIPVTKILDGTDTTTQVFTFTLEAETPGAPMPADPTVKTPADATYTQKATVSFGAIQYDHTHVGQTYQYKITETDSGSGFIGDESEYLVTVQVEWENGLIVPSIQSITLDEQSVEQVAFTNQFVPYTSISGTKTWVDYDNYDRLRPENLTITLLADGSPAEDADGNVMTKTISGEGNVWEYSFENLPKYDGNREIKYTVSEETVDGYVLSRGESEYDLINTHTPVTTITVNKTWSDNNNQDGKRAGVVAKVKLYKTVGETTSELYTETVGAADNWSKTWTELPVYEGGQQITYSVVETLENANSYTSDTTEAVVVANGGSKTITNSYTPEKT